MMISLSPSYDDIFACVNLGKLINADIDTDLFQAAVRSLHTSFNIYATTCPNPFIAPDLIVTPEIRQQSQIYLPVAEISRALNRLYRQALRYPPILSSTPFHKALSWADVFVALPPRFQFSANPARLLEALLSDQGLMREFLFHSFLPKRFYGSFGRYPNQVEFIREWLNNRKGAGSSLRCLDAACGTGEDTYGLAALLMEIGYAPREIEIEGWTLEPLEVWTAAHQCFPHDRQREAAFRTETSQLFEQGFQSSLRFRCADLTETDSIAPLSNAEAAGSAQFDIILCNGLLGGPIINQPEQVEQVVANMVSILAQDGILLAANSFHGGWRSKHGNAELVVLFQKMGLAGLYAGEGIGGGETMI